MAYPIIYKKQFFKSLDKVLNYLELEWGHEIAVAFLVKIDKRTSLLKQQPFVGIASSNLKNVRGILITKHNKLYYKVSNSQVIVLNMYDTRINPKRNPYK